MTLVRHCKHLLVVVYKFLSRKVIISYISRCVISTITNIVSIVISISRCVISISSVFSSSDWFSTSTSTSNLVLVLVLDY